MHRNVPENAASGTLRASTGLGFTQRFRRVQPVLVLLAVIEAVTLTALAQAASPEEEAYQAQLATATEEYRAEQKRCQAGPDGERALCDAQAKDALDRARAQAYANFKGTPRAQMQARVDMAEADYRLALTRCEAAHERDLCQADARVERARSIERAKLDYAYGDAGRNGKPVVDAESAPSTNATRMLGTHECAGLLDLDERYLCIRNAEGAGRM
jgi:hypothetical protein